MPFRRLSSMRPRAVLIGVVICGLAWAPAFGLDTLGIYKFDAPYVPTPDFVVDKMLEMAEVSADDYVADLGSGDGRIPIAAARDYGARALGVELDTTLLAQARKNAQEAGVADKVEFREQDLFETPLHEVTVLTLYLLPEMNARLRPRILSQMRPGAVVVSHAFTLGAWRPDREEVVRRRDVYLWIVPARIEGRWRVETPDGSFDIELEQDYQQVKGRAIIDGRETRIADAALRGSQFRFAVPGADGNRKTFFGRIDDGVMTALPAEDANVPEWRATKQ